MNDAQLEPDEMDHLALKAHLALARKRRRKETTERRKLGHVAAGVDLDKAIAAYRHVAPFRGALGPIKLQVVQRTDRGTRGTAYMARRKIRIAVGPDATPERVLSLLVHEMVHLVMPRDVHHGERFRLTFRRACLNLWGIEVPLDAPPRGGVIAYGMSDLAEKLLQEKIARGETALFPRAPTMPKPSRAELSAKLVEKRAAHAIKMHTKALSALKRAETREAKWHKKVRYYERQAAEKGTSR